jgi:hypothetical protein
MSFTFPDNVSQSDRDKILNSSDTNVRYILVYNGGDEVILPVVIAYDPNKKGIDPASGSQELTNLRLTDNPDYDIPSGFTLKPGEYRILTFPRFAISGRISARTNCTMVPKVYNFSDGNYDGYVCKTGDCRQNPTSYKVSNQGLLCNIIGAVAPTTIVEFSFTDAKIVEPSGLIKDANTDYYDISQVDGGNISASITPIKNQDTSKSDEFWCGNPSCVSDLDCPDELKVYDNSGKQIACQSICAAVSGMQSNYNTDGGKYTLTAPPMIPDGSGSTMYQDFTGPLKQYHPDDYASLQNMFLSQYYWDSTKTTPVLNKDPNTTGPGRWVQDTDNSKCGKSTDKLNPACIPASTLYCCKSSGGNSCGDVGGGTMPSFSSPDQGCSPYVKTIGYSNAEYDKHKCWSENWPVSDTLKSYCDKKGITDCNYHEVFKNKCNKAYSWAFDDFSSTYTCNSPNSQGPPVHYFVQFGGNQPAPTPGPTPSPPTPSPPSVTPSKKPTSNMYWYVLIAVVVLFLIIFGIIASSEKI